MQIKELEELIKAKEVEYNAAIAKMKQNMQLEYDKIKLSEDKCKETIAELEKQVNNKSDEIKKLAKEGAQLHKAIKEKEGEIVRLKEEAKEVRKEMAREDIALLSLIHICRCRRRG
eukprot:TRINITY_DN9067_c0_g1_i3.p2 TRINITY_DN9067_c0_g1~~TRINITY_DN9067_c0_g1_i3.p2  ORF type:complete len:116 (+),score=33.27 TRINITY_DN9067_c0_g1_i3:142-489(+)